MEEKTGINEIKRLQRGYIGISDNLPSLAALLDKLDLDSVFNGEREIVEWVGRPLCLPLCLLDNKSNGLRKRKGGN